MTQKEAEKKSTATRPVPPAEVVSVRKVPKRTMGMPFIQVVISHPSSDTKITLPYTANGTNSCSGGAIVEAMQYEIDEWSPTRGYFTPKSITQFSDTSWSFTISSSDCPITGETYRLTVSAYDGSAWFQSQPVYFSV